MNRGAIYNEQAYAQGKMLDHSSWDFLPRKITPSDVDMVFDNRGWILVCELSRRAYHWDQLPTGQRMLYESFVAKPQIMAVLLKHDVEVGKQIDSLKDVETFQLLMTGDNVTGIYPGSHWESFIRLFYDNPSLLFAKCLECINESPVTIISGKISLPNE